MCLGRERNTISYRTDFCSGSDIKRFHLKHKPTSEVQHLSFTKVRIMPASINVGGIEDFPSSLLDAAAGAMAYEGPNPGLAMRRPVGAPTDPHFFSGSLGRFRGLGGYIDGADVGIAWGRGIQAQGDPWEGFLQGQFPTGARLPIGFKAWDFFDDESGVVISAKTLDTTAYTYANNPGKVYSRLKLYIDSASDYETVVVRQNRKVDPARKLNKQLQVAVPQYTSPAQWRQINQAIIYARGRGVSVVVTRVR